LLANSLEDVRSLWPVIGRARLPASQV